MLKRDLFCLVKTSDSSLNCAFGHLARISDNCAGPEQAARNCFGVVDRVTVVEIGFRRWRSLSQEQKAELAAQLRQLHKEQTGNDLQD